MASAVCSHATAIGAGAAAGLAIGAEAIYAHVANRGMLRWNSHCIDPQAFLTWTGPCRIWHAVLRLALGLDVFGAMAIEGQMKDLMMEIQEETCVDMGSCVYNQNI